MSHYLAKKRFRSTNRFFRVLQPKEAGGQRGIFLEFGGKHPDRWVKNPISGGRGGPGLRLRSDMIEQLQVEQNTMNRRKKLNQILKANAKKASAKLAPKSKDKYISKADRLKLAAESAQDPVVACES
jgi:hypothetical protein